MLPPQIINLSGAGTLRPSGDIETTTADIDRYLEKLKNSGTKHLVLYAHGGLVSESDGIAAVRNFASAMAGRELSAATLAFVWETGPLETLRSRLDRIGADDLFRPLLRLALRFALAKAKERLGGERGLSLVDDGVRGEVDDALKMEDGTRKALPYATGETAFGEFSFEDFQELGDAVRDDPDLSDALAATAERLHDAPAGGGRGIGDAAPEGGAAPDRYPLIGGPIREALEAGEVGGERAIGGVGAWVLPKVVVTLRQVLTAVAGRYFEGTDHGLHATCVEELLRHCYGEVIGGEVWGEMKRNAADAFASNAGRAGAAVRGGRYFVDGLAKLVAADPDLEVSLVGHSAGSIFLTHLIEAADAEFPAGFAFGHVCFLAPAVTFELFAERFLPRRDRVARFDVFALDDARERADTLVKSAPWLYPSSLLYLVSGLCEDRVDEPLLGMQRFVDREPPVADSAELRRYLRDRRAPVWSPADDGPGRRTQGTSHGGVDDDPATLDSVAEILRGVAS